MESTQSFVLLLLVSTVTSLLLSVSAVEPEDRVSFELKDNGPLSNTRNVTARRLRFDSVEEARLGSPRSIGQPCEHHSDCSNAGVCLLLATDDDTVLKACQCDMAHMKEINGSCFTKPGHQCYFPNSNKYGQRFTKCLHGSVCKEAVNETAPNNGYCMCDAPSSELHYRYLDVDFEMAHCGASSVSFKMFSYSILLLSVIVFKSSISC